MPKSPEEIPVKKQEGEKSHERERRKLSPAEANEYLTGMEEFIEGLSTLLAEKRAELRIETDSARIGKLGEEIAEIELEIEGLSEFAHDGRQEGAELFRLSSDSGTDESNDKE